MASRALVAGLVLAAWGPLDVSAPAHGQTGDFALPAGGSCLTSGCHSDLTAKNFVHAAAEDGSECDLCHETAGAGRHQFEGIAAGADLCLECHEGETDGPLQHGPVALGDCIECHDPHASEYPHLLIGPYPEASYAKFSVDGYFCFECHDVAAFTDARTADATAFRNGDLNLHYRHVNKAKGRTCRTCHEHHAAAGPALIKPRAAFGSRGIDTGNLVPTETGGGCAPTCHHAAAYDRVAPQPTPFRVSPRPPADPLHHYQEPGTRNPGEHGR